MYEAGLVSMGALAILLLAFGWAAWIFRGHRGDLSGLAIRREWTPLAERDEFRDWERLPMAPGFVGPNTPASSPDRVVVTPMVQHGQRTVRERGEDE